mgnify:CR=1 FL=1
MKIGIIGNGFVGKATRVLECEGIEIMCYDIDPKLCIPEGTTLEELCECDIIFISVPTPMNEDGSCFLNIVESVVDDISKIVNLDEKLVVIRSTIPPGTSKRLNCYFMPEFLTEKNYIDDFVNNPEWVFGVKGNDTLQDSIFMETIKKMIELAHYNNKIKYDNISYVLNTEAEMIKLFRNTFLATKVAYCNEIYEFCEKSGINYESVRDLATRDTRIGEGHTNVPGHDGKKGFGGTCFPKDINSLLHEMKKLDMDSYILKSVITRNETHDRPENDWKEDKGRATV